ncbi:50S ribosomal protein L23 [bacterium]|nr:50S ribosomal protein L23 [bacterium]
MNDPHKIVIAPIITEKATSMRETENKYLFYVHPKANKKNIKRSIEELFKVDVINIRTQNLLGQPRIRGQHTGRTALRKKAIVRIKEGQKIPFFEGLV